MKTQEKGNFSFASNALGLLIFAFTLTIGVGIPDWQRIFTTNSETAAVQAIGMIRICQSSYADRHQGNFAPTFAELVKIGCLDSDKFSNELPIIDNHIFTMKVEEPSAMHPAFYLINADPQISSSFNLIGSRHFYYDSTLGTMRFTKENRQATVDDPSI